MVLEEIRFNKELEEKINEFIIPYGEHVTKFKQKNEELWHGSDTYAISFDLAIQSLVETKLEVFDMLVGLSDQRDFLGVICRYRKSESDNPKLFEELTLVFHQIGLFNCL